MLTRKIDTILIYLDKKKTLEIFDLITPDARKTFR